MALWRSALLIQHKLSHWGSVVIGYWFSHVCKTVLSELQLCLIRWSVCLTLLIPFLVGLNFFSLGLPSLNRSLFSPLWIPLNYCFFPITHLANFLISSFVSLQYKLILCINTHMYSHMGTNVTFFYCQSSLISLDSGSFGFALLKYPS